MYLRFHSLFSLSVKMAGMQKAHHLGNITLKAHCNGDGGK